MTTNKKPVRVGIRAGSGIAFDRYNYTATDRLKGWLELAVGVNDSRNRKPKRGWQRGAKR